MKQAKFALTAVAVLAVIGGALAFKANRVTVKFYTPGTTATTQQSVCNSPVDLFYTPSAAGLTTILASTTVDNTNPCKVIHVRENI